MKLYEMIRAKWIAAAPTADVEKVLWFVRNNNRGQHYLKSWKRI